MRSLSPERELTIVMFTRAAALLLLLSLAIASAPAQSFQVLHSFTGQGDGGHPYAGLAIDQAGNLYGTTYDFGSAGYGIVFKLAHHNGAWTLAPLYTFQGGVDGQNPKANVVFGPDGNLYSTTWQGGTNGSGTVFKLQPSATACHSALCSWTKNDIHDFGGLPDGGLPSGTLLFDQAGNIYGVTELGGIDDDGTVYELTHTSSGWTHTVLYGEVGGSPMSGVVFDRAGNLYGTTLIGGGLGYGSVYQLAHSGSSWTINTLTSFEDDGDGVEPVGGVIFDAAGNLYAGTSGGGDNGGGTVFEMTSAGGNWSLTNLYELPLGLFGVMASLSMDAAGNLYGATEDEGAYGYGSVFKLTRSQSGWVYTDLYDFTNGSDGAYPVGNVALDANGNIYGTAGNGGLQQCPGSYPGCGTVWEITP